MTIEAFEWDEVMLSWNEEPSQWGSDGLAAMLDEFADRFLDGGRAANPVGLTLRASLRAWRQVDVDADLGRQVGFETAEVVAASAGIHPADVVVLCERRREGRQAAIVIEACGYPIVHRFDSDGQARHAARDQMRSGCAGIRGLRSDEFAPGATGTAVREIVIGIGHREVSRQRFHDALAMLAQCDDDRHVMVTVVCSDPELAEFGAMFRPDESKVDSLDHGWSSPEPTGLVHDEPPAVNG